MLVRHLFMCGEMTAACLIPCKKSMDNSLKKFSNNSTELGERMWKECANLRFWIMIKYNHSCGKHLDLFTTICLSNFYVFSRC